MQVQPNQPPAVGAERTRQGPATRLEGDPFGGLSVTTPGFSRIGEAIAGLGLPTVIVQEGGYLCDALGDNLTAFLTGFGGKQR